MDRSAEDELLIRCIGAGVDAADAARLGRFTGSQWAGIVRKSVLLGVGPLFSRSVRKAESPVAIPPAVRTELRQMHIESAAANLRLYHDLSGVLACLRADGVEVIVLKGAFLAAIVYDEIALRPMGDVDLLVRREDLPKAEASLSRAGFAADRRNLHASEDCPYHVLFTCPSGTVVEVHWDVADPAAPFRIEIGDLWDRARPARIADVETLALCPEDLILHLCMHASYAHRFSMGPRQLCDLNETIRHYGDHVDWPRLLHAAEEYGLNAYVYYPLLLATKLLGADVPAATLSDLRPDASDPKFVEMLEQQMFDVTPMTIPGFWGTWVVLGSVGRAEGLRGRIAALWRSVFPPASRIREMYGLSAGSKLALLYYPRRLWDLVRARWKQVLHWAFRTKAAKHLLAREKARETIGKTLAAEQRQWEQGPQA